VARVAIVTDTACDLSPDQAAAAGISMVPLFIRFGDVEQRAVVEMSTLDFYARLLAPGAPFPSTSASSPGDFAEEFRARVDGGASAIVCLTISSTLSATWNAARLAAETAVGVPVHVVDSETVTMAQGLLALLAAEAAAAGERPEEIVRLLEARRRDARVFFVLDTLEYLRRGGRISAAQAAIGTVLSVKPVLTVVDGVVVTVDKPRTLSRARARLMEVATARPVERLAIVHTMSPAVDAFREELSRTLGYDPAVVPIGLVGPTVAPHVGPRAFGAAMITAPD
jgi:DegV family protein with EDD domain